MVSSTYCVLIYGMDVVIIILFIGGNGGSRAPYSLTGFGRARHRGEWLRRERSNSNAVRVNGTCTTKLPALLLITGRLSLIK
jgi:hypothetical protein